MSRTVSQLKYGIAGLLTGTNINNVTNIYNALERALRNFLQKASVPEASTALSCTLYDGVYNYTAPSDIFGGAIRDFRPIGVSRNPTDFAYKKTVEQFDRTKAILPNGYAVTFETRNGQNIMRVANTKARQMIVLDPMSALTTSTNDWTASGSATNLVVDQTFFYQTPASLRFKVTGSSTGSIRKILANGLDLTDYQGVGVVFLAFQVPLASSLTSVLMKIGSDASNYYQVTSTTQFLGSFIANDFMIVAFDLSTATTVGSPTITAMKYLNITIAHSATMTNVRVGSMWISLPSPHELVYESTSIFQNSSGTLSNFISSDNDLILLSDAAYNIYEHECAITCGLQMGGSMASGVIGNINSLLNGARARNGQVIALGLYDRYRADNPSEELRQVNNWYDDM